MRRIILLALLPALFLAGCYTISETPYPDVRASQIKGGAKVALNGFDAVELGYTSTYSYTTTMHAPPPMHHRFHGHYHPPVMDTYMTETLTPILRNTDEYRTLARDILEKAGCNLQAGPPEWTVSLEFSGPVETTSDACKSAGIQLASLLFATWERVYAYAKVRVHDSTGQLVFSEDYTQEFKVSGWSPLWVFGIASFGKDTSSYMQKWCYTALVDRAMCDVTAFLASQKK